MQATDRISPEARCLKCRTAVKGVTYLRIGAKLKLDGHSVLCLSCVDKLMVEGRHQTVRAFVGEYINANQVDSVKTLKQRLADLEALVDSLTRPEA